MEWKNKVKVQVTQIYFPPLFSDEHKTKQICCQTFPFVHNQTKGNYITLVEEALHILSDVDVCLVVRETETPVKPSVPVCCISA